MPHTPSFTVNSGCAGHSCWNRLMWVLELERQQHSPVDGSLILEGLPISSWFSVTCPSWPRLGVTRHVCTCTGLSQLYHLRFTTNIFLSIRLDPRNCADWPVVYLLFDSTCSEKPIHSHLFLLAYSPSTFPSLEHKRFGYWTSGSLKSVWHRATDTTVSNPVWTFNK